ncbi:replication fork protection component Swi3-domain-containing protein [Aspergillus coremiiformis]|uniref:Chromosome segregation in meiosis protein n=1 Tax=Aspergillus coremiiformis TaxID=138285 RepID=A0A5N6YUW3_9EURO|nr:replication fork protection component Swi3-domain-containing protein [Aspergillus coremiiformis]
MAQNSHSDIPQGSSSRKINDLFDYDVGFDAILQHAPTTSNLNALRLSSTVPGASGLGLGLDEEVEVSKKRQPVAKLDESRLLSPAGIPRLRRTAKQNLKFQGKGHEFTDAARLLNFYQLWLDDLFPRAKLADGLSMIEKLGHHRRLQIMRREWIEEEKPRVQMDDTGQLLRANQSSLPTATTSEGNNAVGTHITRAVGVENDGADKAQSNKQSAIPAHERFMSDYENSQYSITQAVSESTDELGPFLREQRDEDITTKPISTVADLNNIDSEDGGAVEEFQIMSPTWATPSSSHG